MAVKLSKLQQEAIVLKCTDIIAQGTKDNKIYMKKHGVGIDGKYDIFRKKDNANIFSIPVECHADVFYVEFIFLDQKVYKINSKPSTSWENYVDTSELVNTLKSCYAVCTQREKLDKQREKEVLEQAAKQERIKQFNKAMLSLIEISNTL